MKQLDRNTVTIVAFSVIALVAAVLLWVSLNAPDSDEARTLPGIVWLIASLFVVVGGIRRKPFVRAGFDQSPWLLSAVSVLLFFAVFYKVAQMDAFVPAPILHELIFLILAVFFLLAAIVKRRDARSTSEDQEQHDKRTVSPP